MVSFFFLLRVVVSSTNSLAHVHTHTYTFSYTYTYACTYTYTISRACTFSRACTCAFACARACGRGRVGIQRWVGEYVLVRVCVVCADSLRSVPQEKMELNSFVR